MIKKLAFIIYKILLLLDQVFTFFTKKTFMIYMKDYIEKKAYTSIKILNKNIKFFIPNKITNWRVETFFLKEPETLEWIDSFEKKEKIIFWDIGANIGLYSIYNSLKNKNSISFAFEPSSSNLRVLTRNISINNLESKIKVLPFALTNYDNVFQTMNEGQFTEGGALNTFGKEYNFEGKKFRSSMKYNIYGTSINYLVKNSILDIPDYIKIDVDGIEHLIIKGGDKILHNKKIKSISIEINENFKEQYKKIISLMYKFNFKLLHKKHNEQMFSKKNKFNKVYNYLFIKK